MEHEIIDLIDRYWKFDQYQMPTSGWHDKQDLLQEVRKVLQMQDVIRWVAFDCFKIETRPTGYGKYLICRKDGKIHWETWNGSGWAYNHNEIRFWAVITPPIR
jgi:hypothetical protein